MLIAGTFAFPIDVSPPVLTLTLVLNSTAYRPFTGLNSSLTPLVLHILSAHNQPIPYSTYPRAVKIISLQEIPHPYISPPSHACLQPRNGKFLFFNSLTLQLLHNHAISLNTKPTFGISTVCSSTPTILSWRFRGLPFSIANIISDQ